jgi:hypothetical protein
MIAMSVTDRTFELASQLARKRQAPKRVRLERRIRIAKFELEELQRQLSALDEELAKINSVTPEGKSK